MSLFFYFLTFGEILVKNFVRSFWRKFNLMVERSLRMGCMMLKIANFREWEEICGRACQNASLQAAMRNLGTSKNSKWRFVGMQISEVRMQNWEFACGGCRTCKQNYLRNLRWFSSLCAAARLRTNCLFCILRSEICIRQTAIYAFLHGVPAL